MSDEHSPTDEPLTDVELDGVAGGTGTCTLHGGVATPHEEWRTSGAYSYLYRCDGAGYKYAAAAGGRG
jgi:hypothetical protein